LLIAIALILLISTISVAYTPTVVLAQEAKVDLSLRMLPDYYYKEVIPGEENTLFMEVRNNGNIGISNIKFDSDRPKGWIVNFEPKNIAYLSAGSSQTIDVKVIPSSATSREEYNLTIIAEATETRAATGTMLRVESGPSIWLWVGVGVTALVVVGFVVIFLRFGKQ
jgi:uncharacterized membrane protein